MLDAEFDQLEGRRWQIGERTCHLSINRRSPLAHFVEAGAADHPAPRPGVAVAFALVIAVEEEGPALFVQPIAGDMIAQDEGFEKPGRMRQMPFRRRGVRMRLNGRIRIAQRRGEVERELPRRG